MGFVGDFIGDVFGGGDDAADAATDAADIQAKYQREALNYLKQREKLPQQFREGALTRLAGIAGLEGGEGSQKQLIDQAVKSPLYQAIMGGQEAGEEAILRNAAATGGLRSGDTSYNLADFNTWLENQALLKAYDQQLSGLQGLSGLPSNTNAIAQQTSGIGQTLAQGQIGAAQAQQSGIGAGIGNLAGLTSIGIEAGPAIMGGLGKLAGLIGFSDRRLKKDIKHVGKRNGFNWYRWKWNSVGEKIGLTGESQGVLADELYEQYPEAVGLRNGFMVVDYRKLGVM